MNVTRSANDRCWRVSNLTLLLALLLSCARVCPAEDFGVLTNAAQVRQLTRAEAQSSRPVRLRGVVVYWDPGLELLVVQDDTAGVFIRVPSSELPLARGQ